MRTFGRRKKAASPAKAKLTENETLPKQERTGTSYFKWQCYFSFFPTLVRYSVFFSFSLFFFLLFIWIFHLLEFGLGYSVSFIIGIFFVINRCIKIYNIFFRFVWFVSTSRFDVLRNGLSKNMVFTKVFSQPTLFRIVFRAVINYSMKKFYRTTYCM